MEASLVVAVLAAHFISQHRHVGDVALVHLIHELGEVNFLVFGPGATGADHLVKDAQRKQNHNPENNRFYS